MTRIVDEEVVCHICGTQYKGPVLLSYNSVMGKPDIKPLVCPKCSAPAKTTTPETHGGVATTVLLLTLEDKNKAVDDLCKSSRNEADMDKYVKMMKEKDLDGWEKSNDETLKDAEKNNDDRWVAEFKDQAEKIGKLKKLREDGTLNQMIDEVASMTRECLRKERAEYEAKIG